MRVWLLEDPVYQGLRDQLRKRLQTYQEQAVQVTSVEDWQTIKGRCAELRAILDGEVNEMFIEEVAKHDR